jgi:hypothetical protein
MQRPCVWQSTSREYGQKEAVLAKNRYTYEKRRREIEKKRKNEEKRQRKLDKRTPPPDQNEGAPAAGDDDTLSTED